MPKLLLVEDPDDEQVSLSKTIEKTNIEFDVISSSENLLEVIIKGEFDIVVLDLSMYNSASLFVLNKIKNNKGFSGLHFIITVRLSREYTMLDNGYLDSADKVFGNPFNIVDFSKHLLQFFDKKQA